MFNIEKYLKKNGGSSMVLISDEYENTLDTLINNDNNIMHFLKGLSDLCVYSLQSHKNVPISDKILINLFEINDITKLKLIKEYIDIINASIYYYISNPENRIKSNSLQIEISGIIKLITIKEYNTILGRLYDMIKFDNDDEPKIKHLKCLIKSIKQIENLDIQSLNNTKNPIKVETEKQKIIERYKLFSNFDTTKLAEYINAPIKPTNIKTPNLLKFKRSTNKPKPDDKCYILKNQIFLNNIIHQLKL
jgi:hypothetical protein